MNADMTPEAQRIAIAEACGYKVFVADGKHGTARYNGSQVFSAGGAYIILKAGKEPALGPIPRYLHSLDAMHEAEKELQHFGFYHDTLATVMKEPRNGIMLIHATAAQRAEAFLRTLGKWEKP